MTGSSQRHAPIPILAITVGATQAAFVLAGSFKGHSALAMVPLDLSMVFGVLSLGLTLSLLARGKARFGPGIWVLALLFAACAVSLTWTDWTDYARSKVVRMFTLTLWSAVGSALIFQARGAVAGFRFTVVALGLLGAIDAFVTRDPQGLENSAALGADTISSARIAALCAVLAWVAALRSRRSAAQGMAFLVAGAMVWEMQAIGSRGPAIALVVALVVVTARLSLSRHRRGLRVLVGTLLVVGAFSYGLFSAPTQSRTRLEEFYQGQTALQGSVRGVFYLESAKAIPTNPFGIGWGGFERLIVGRDKTFGGGTLTGYYPHNLLLEVTLEGGWGVGLLLIAAIALALHRSWTCRNLDVGAVALAGLVLTGVAAMFSGDFNDNRDFFAFMAMALVSARCATSVGARAVAGRDRAIRQAVSASSVVPESGPDLDGPAQRTSAP